MLSTPQSSASGQKRPARQAARVADNADQHDVQDDIQQHRAQPDQHRRPGVMQGIKGARQNLQQRMAHQPNRKKLQGPGRRLRRLAAPFAALEQQGHQRPAERHQADAGRDRQEQHTPQRAT